MKKITVQEKSIHDQFVMYGRNAKEWMRKCELLLPHIEKHRIWQIKGFENIYEYAAKLAGMSRYRVNESLRIFRKIEDKPLLMKVVEQKGIFAVKPVVAIVTTETASFWAEKAKMMTKNTLETYVKEFKKVGLDNQNLLSPSDSIYLKQNALFEAKNADFERPRTSAQTEIIQIGSQVPSEIFITMQLESEIAGQLEKLKGQGSWNDLVKQLLEIREQQLEAQKPQVKGVRHAVQPIKPPARSIPNATKKYVIAKTNGQCAYPGCTKPFDIFQHAQRWALKKVHDPDQLWGLCNGHEQLAHLGLIENENLAPKFWKIRKKADENDPKFAVDKIVQKFRTPK